MTPPSVLLDRTFVEALTLLEHGSRHEAHTTYARLVDGHERHELRIRARHDHLALVPAPLRNALLAPVAAIHVARQHRRQAARLELPFELDPDTAVTLVVLRREGISRVASFDPVFEQLDLAVHT